MKEREGFRSAMIGGCLSGTLEVGKLEERHLYDLLGNIFGFLWLVLNWKRGKRWL